MLNAKVEINLLGDVSVKINDTLLEFKYEKVRFLCAYVIAEGRPILRSQLASLLWPDRDDIKARTNLRQAIASLKHTFGPHFARMFAVSRRHMEFCGYESCVIDCERLKKISVLPLESLENILQEVISPASLYSGPFCHGLLPRAGKDAAVWLRLRRNEYETIAWMFVRKLSTYYIKNHQHNHVLELHSKMISTDWFDKCLMVEHA